MQAGLLAKADPTGKVALDPPHETHIAIADIAPVLATVLDMPSTYRRVIMAVNSNTPIKQALESLWRFASVNASPPPQNEWTLREPKPSQRSTMFQIFETIQPKVRIASDS